ncbi:hypothetical protein [Leclercia adecarboxylata]|uniref:hypothetical protein n=1 Tax=Leclercia adecarboxylata TaxID=83655 RepID=UPI0013FDB275|nr:hypothetical protein [Leclercia adecarboxylata]QIM43332.1 hypothetical protein G7098_11480 [Leclercia adecarboxylata]
MSDSLNNKELVAVGHQFAKTMSSDTPIIDMAKIVSRLAERLDCTTVALREMTKQRDGLAAEVHAVKNYRPQPGGAAMMKALDAFEAQDDYPEGGMADAFEILCCKSVESPAIDAFLAEVRAQVWIEAKVLAKSAIDSDSIDHIDFLFDGKAAQLRQGGAA